MAQKTISIADLSVSSSPQDVLITYALGSCIGVAVYDPKVHVGGLLHYMLPLSKTSPDKAKAKPAMFADTGIPLLLKKVFAAGATKKDLIVKVAGGSKLLDNNNVFNIGEKNFLVLRKIFWKNNILMKAHHVGGSLSRTMRLDLSSGVVTVKAAGKEFEL